MNHQEFLQEVEKNIRMNVPKDQRVEVNTVLKNIDDKAVNQ